MSQSTQKGPSLDLPVEIWLDVLPHLSQQSILNLAITYPKVFAGSSLNVFILDAKNQVLTNHKQKDPLLYCCFRDEGRKSIHTSYMKKWHTDCYSAMEFALCYKQPKSFCDYANDNSGFVRAHEDEYRKNIEECAILLHAAGVPFFQSYPWCTIKGVVTERITANGSLNDESTDDESTDDEFTDDGSTDDESITNYYSKCDWYKDPFDYEPDNFWIRGRYQKLLFPINRGFSRVFKAMVDPLLAREKDDEFQKELGRVLEVACVNQPWWADRKIIEYLVSVGAPLVADYGWANSYYQFIGCVPDEPIIPFQETLVYKSVDSGRLKTAAFLLKRYVDNRMRLDFENLKFRSCGGHDDDEILGSVKAFYDAMEVAARYEDAFLRGKKATAEDLHICLLVEAVWVGHRPSTQWLLSQGVGLSEDLDTCTPGREIDLEKVKNPRQGEWYNAVDDLSLAMRAEKAVTKLYKSLYGGQREMPDHMEESYRQYTFWYLIQHGWDAPLEDPQWHRRHLRPDYPWLSESDRLAIY
ncbi:hypothetical protein F5Y08DRAFT_354356 [Xylaria arbuscula]|nr:hypothetical protein F5Y08DRAFT_354356 [Xylaria arbuscula]